MIDECSTAPSEAYSFGLELKHAVPMTVPSEDDTENSHHQHFGYGHTYDQTPMPQSAMYHTKPVIPSTYPSLMDSSVSSATTESTAPSVLGGSNMMIKHNLTNTLEIEEREDSLPRITLEEPGVILIQDDAMENPGSHGGGVAHGHQDPLMATLSSANIPPPQVNGGAAMNDPRLTVDYERRYIVDLEQINEESSGNEMGSQGGSQKVINRNASGASSISSHQGSRSIGKMAPIVGAPVTSGFQPGSNNAAAIPEAYAQQQPKAPTQFYNYRHQYYTEQYHYCDEQFSQAPKGGGDDDTNSTCSSVTLSQAFHPDETDSCSSSITNSSSMISTVSSVTLSRALSAERQDHSGQGFYVATRLGDFVEVPNEQPDESSDIDESAGSKPIKEEEEEEEVSSNQNGNAGTDTDTKSDTKSAGEDYSHYSTDGEIDLMSDATAPGSKAAANQISKAIAEDIESDILSTLVPECGVPIPSVMAKVGTTRSKSRGGMLLPWHSTRSIQNYQGRRGKKKGSSSLYSSRSLFSISSVHSFRG